MLVHAHPIELEAEPPTQLADRILAALVVRMPVRSDGGHDEIHVLHVSLIEGKVHLYLFLRNPFEDGEVEYPGCVCHIDALYHGHHGIRDIVAGWLSARIRFGIS